MKKSSLTTEPEYLASFPLSFSALSVPNIGDIPEFGFVYGAALALSGLLVAQGQNAETTENAGTIGAALRR